MELHGTDGCAMERQKEAVLWPAVLDATESHYFSIPDLVNVKKSRLGRNREIFNVL